MSAGYPASRGPSIFPTYLGRSKGLCSQGSGRPARLPSGCVLASFYNTYVSELIFKKVATEIEHILRLSKLKEYASH